MNCHLITEILLKVELNTITPNPLDNITYLLTLLSVRMVTFSDGSTLSTSNFQSAASVVDSRISSGLELSLSCCYKRTHFCCIIIQK